MFYLFNHLLRNRIYEKRAVSNIDKKSVLNK